MILISDKINIIDLLCIEHHTSILRIFKLLGDSGYSHWSSGLISSSRLSITHDNVQGTICAARD